jgi:hypothetical protein
MSFELQFFGATGEVTGSPYVIRTQKIEIAANV